MIHRNDKAIVVDGVRIAKEIKDEIREEVRHMTSVGKRPPHLAVLLVGNDPASLIYVKHKRKAADYTGNQHCLVLYFVTSKLDR